MKQKVVIKISMEGHKSRSKALKVAVGVCGVESAALKGDDKSQIEVTGDGMDSVALTSLLRKKVGYAELVSVGPADGGQKKEEPKKENEVKVQPIQYWPVYHGGVPHYDYPVVAVDRHSDPCSIM
ncbi:Heavy metal-associated isoprenylated plant protein [Melia azedarach]|uniref:Heavy metal-associated isoprenylated plant protein n=1 Tax=Melia azedarach TaxID=155640 RepID=A0ACC1Z3B2_MELAZ|nr:Heavy metal-associated isoprenylated plant protein [Melia azedarach]